MANSTSSRSQSSSLSTRWFWLILGGLVALAAVFRLWRLAEFPAGLHQDEAWFAYNAFLLLKRGTNIYGEHWPLTVDMWGDHVSAVHSYMIVPFIALFGVHTWAFRLTFVFFSMVCLGLAAYFMWQLSRSQKLVLGTVALFSLSVWNIVMTRASSTVIIDTAILLLVCVVFYKTVAWSSQVTRWTRNHQWKFALGLLASYGLTIAAYFTYFTSRLLIPPFLLGLLVFAWWGHKRQWLAIGAAGVVVLAYMVFPFGVMLKTPYALGRYQETAIINSNTVKSNQFQNITRAGQSGLPVLVTRTLYNKGMVNVQAFLKQYVGLLSPSVLLFQTAPPKRYDVPNAGAISYLEYAGFLALIGIVCVGGPKHRYFKLSLLLLWLVLVAALPSALTEDDFPNMQRAVIMTPFFQMAAAVGILVTLQQLWQAFGNYKPSRQAVIYIGLILLLSAPTFTSYLFGYYAQMKYSWPHFRSRAGEELAVWINHEAHDDPILMEHVEGNFFYPYLFNQEDMLAYPIELDNKYFLKSEKFKIGNRTFVHNLCSSAEMQSPDYKYIIVYTLHEKCRSTDNLVKVFSAKYDDGDEGFGVYRRKTPEELGISADGLSVIR